MFKVEVDKVHSELEVGRHVPAEPVRTVNLGLGEVASDPRARLHPRSGSG